ncbi:MAG: deoxyguanosinetriphosphate triphosphohydrolase [Bacillota bacterium]|nr:deoxyguanosinetriphosphate triphosphohydrolase [Bacillota bacterium]
MTVRERTEALEEKILCEYAALSKNSKGRLRPEEQDSIRTVYQRDRDRILHSKSFRRLKHKTQVFLSPEGDHYRTRLTHTLEVSQIARTIARALEVNEDLTEAIALGHDLGHTPFGHAGERALNEVANCGFHHYEQSVRVVEILEKNGQGLNLTCEVKDGINCHTKGPEASTLEGRIVKIADRIAYINHDIDDAIRAGVLSENDIPSELTDFLGHTTSGRINSLVLSVVDNSNNGQLIMDDKTAKAFDDLHQYMFDYVYTNSNAKGEEKKVPDFIARLFFHFRKNPNKMPEELQEIAEKEGVDRAVCDYIANMTDHFAIGLYESIFIPKNWKML